MTENTSDLQAVDQLNDSYRKIKSEIAKVIIGQDKVIEQLLIALLASGHCLLVGVPGLAKTLLISILANILDLKFSRIQFTPDLMPSDITGTEIIEEERSTGKREFKFVKGPVFANVILADEINRTPPKTQAALLQAMQEHEVTSHGQTFTLDEPFFVLATQNPIEQEGTYPLPEAQVDRFMLKLVVDYPRRDEEKLILDAMAVTDKEIRVEPVADPDDILAVRSVIDDIYIDEKIKEYILNIVFATRRPQDYDLPLEQFIRYGASPRATIYLTMAAKAQAFLSGRGYVVPQDVKSTAHDVLRHRVLISYEAEAEELTADDIISRILESLPVP